MVLHSKNGYPEFCSKTSRITYLTFLLSEKIKQNYSPQGLETKPTALIIDVNLWKSIRVFPALWRNICKLYPFIRTLAVKKWSDQSKTYRPIRKSAYFDKESSYFFFSLLFNHKLLSVETTQKFIIFTLNEIWFTERKRYLLQSHN